MPKHQKSLIQEMWTKNSHNSHQIINAQQNDTIEHSELLKSNVSSDSQKSGIFHLNQLLLIENIFAKIDKTLQIHRGKYKASQTETKFFLYENLIFLIQNENFFGLNFLRILTSINESNEDDHAFLNQIKNLLDAEKQRFYTDYVDLIEYKFKNSSKFGLHTLLEIENSSNFLKTHSKLLNTNRIQNLFCNSLQQIVDLFLESQNLEEYKLILIKLFHEIQTCITLKDSFLEVIFDSKFLIAQKKTIYSLLDEFCNQKTLRLSINSKKNIIMIQFLQFFSEHYDIKSIILPEFFSLVKLTSNSDLITIYKHNGTFLCVCYSLFFLNNLFDKIKKCPNLNGFLFKNENRILRKSVTFIIRINFISPLISMLNIKLAILVKYNFYMLNYYFLNLALHMQIQIDEAEYLSIEDKIIFVSMSDKIASKEQFYQVFNYK